METAGIRRRQHVEAQAVRLELDRKRRILGDQPVKFGKGAFNKFEGHRDRESGRTAPVLRSLLSAAHFVTVPSGSSRDIRCRLPPKCRRDRPVLDRRAIGRIDQRVALEIVRARRFGGDAALQTIKEMAAGAERAFLATCQGWLVHDSSGAPMSVSLVLPSLVTGMRQPVSTTMEPRGALDLDQRLGERVGSCAGLRRCTRRR